MSPLYLVQFLFSKEEFSLNWVSPQAMKTGGLRGDTPSRSIQLCWALPLLSISFSREKNLMIQDQIHIKDLLLRTIIGVNPDERVNKQDVLINITLYTDPTAAAESDKIQDTVDYKKLTKQIIKLVEESQFFLVEKLAGEVSRICLRDIRVRRTAVTVEKPGALRFARSVGVTVDRERTA
jgi:FolB domain-containing protein